MPSTTAVRGPAARVDRLRRVAGDGDELALVHIGHLAPLPELGVHHVRPGGRERHLDLQLTGASGRLGVHVGERAEVCRVAMRCIHAWWLRVRSVTGSPVSASTTVAVTVVGTPGRVLSGT